MTALEIAIEYYARFNKQDWKGMLALAHADIRHEPNQGEPRVGIEKFTEFLQRMDEAYAETLTHMVFYTEPSGSRIAVRIYRKWIVQKRR